VEFKKMKKKKKKNVNDGLEKRIFLFGVGWGWFCESG
jgi:hypothetical protein